MIVSHLWKFIFVKTVKTAGTSIELALSGLCGPDDIVTPVGVAYEPLRAGAKPQNYIRGDGRRNLRADGLPEPNERTDFYNHIGIERASAYLGPVAAGYFKFSVTRNPWDRQVSQFYFDRSAGAASPDLDFRGYILSRPRRPNPSWDHITSGGRLAVDFVGRYEAIEADLAEALRRIGCDRSLRLPNAKGGIRPAASRDYRAYYHDDTREIVARWYAEEIAAFGYAF